MKSKLSEPKDLGLKVGSKEEQFWIDFAEKVKAEIEEARRMIIINRDLLKLAEKKIKEEKEKFK